MSDFEAPSIPLPAAFVAPWLEDNQQFIDELAAFRRQLEEVAPTVRKQLDGKGAIRTARSAGPFSLAAVDAAVVDVQVADRVSILLQVARVEDDGQTILGPVQRVSGVNGHEMQMLRTPLRLAMECRELAASTGLTIADTSFWSFLMETNQACSRLKNRDNEYLNGAVRALVDEGLFLAMVENPQVIAMSKLGESDILLPGISDRTLLEFVLRPGEYLRPRTLIEATRGTFGIEHRFDSGDRDRITQFYRDGLGVLFFKPHPWSRAYRIEGHTAQLNDDNWLMSMLAAISKHTATRGTVEPWPQFMADYTVKQIAAVAALYGDGNSFRLPIIVPTRT
jgi:hypothetical protein